MDTFEGSKPLLDQKSEIFSDKSKRANKYNQMKEKGVVQRLTAKPIVEKDNSDIHSLLEKTLTA